MTSMLPALPKSFGTLKHVFSSAAAAISGAPNYFALSKAKSAIVILVDGLGHLNLRDKPGHAPFLNAASAKPIACEFPSTTAASISSFATGKSVGEHGMIGYKIYDRRNKRSLNLLTGLGVEVPAADYQLAETISQARTSVHVVSLAEYRDSGFSQATMPNATFHAAKSLSERFELAAEVARSKGALVYLYVPELDQAAHKFGWNSREWFELLETLDAEVKSLVNRLGSDTGVLLTADHGVVDVDHSQQIYLDEFKEFLPTLIDVAGDPRAVFLYTDDAIDTTLINRLQTELGDRVAVLTKQQLIDSGLYEQLNSAAEMLLPDVLVLAIKNVAIYHRDFARPKSLNMIGQHGSISDLELLVPLLRWGAWKL